ncbi:hypothetical protein AWT69_002442 [Pseudomonas putida]|nr:hypothetical protein AWT69_002442 [Pseudomonas putida]
MEAVAEAENATSAPRIALFVAPGRQGHGGGMGRQDHQRVAL